MTLRHRAARIQRIRERPFLPRECPRAVDGTLRSMRWLWVLVGLVVAWWLTRRSLARVEDAPTDRSVIERRLAEVEREIEAAIKRLESLDRTMRAAQRRAEGSESRAMIAVRAGRDEDARAALLEAKSHRDEQQRLRSERATQSTLLETLEKQRALYRSVLDRRRG